MAHSEDLSAGLKFKCELFETLYRVEVLQVVSSIVYSNWINLKTGELHAGLTHYVPDFVAFPLIPHNSDKVLEDFF